MDTLDRYLDWYRHDPREQIAHTLHHFFGALRWVHDGCFRYAKLAHDEALDDSAALETTPPLA